MRLPDWVVRGPRRKAASNGNAGRREESQCNVSVSPYGGDTAMLEDTVKFFTEKGQLKPGLDSKQLVNTTILHNALKIVGTAPGAR